MHPSITMRVESLEFETLGPTLVRITWRGELTPGAIRAWHEFALFRRAEQGLEGAVLDVVVNAKEATGAARGARREITEFRRDKPWNHLAIVGVRFEVKVMLELLLEAVRLLDSKPAVVRFMDTEAEAFAWIEGER